MTAYHDLLKVTDNTVEPLPSSSPSVMEISSGAAGEITVVSDIVEEQIPETATNNDTFDAENSSTGTGGGYDHLALQSAPDAQTPETVPGPVRLILTPINRVKYMS